jgi:hypothetical protein
MSNIRIALLALSIALLTTACVAAGASPDATTPDGSPSGSPDASPSESPAPSGIPHATGPTDVLLRYEVGGGFVPFGYFVTQAPTFTLYGDGTVIFRDETASPQAPDGSVSRMVPFMTARLSEAQIQALLAFALDEGGLATARDSYPYDMIADAPSSIFEIHADGIDKTVSVYALGIDGPDVPDTTDRRTFEVLAEVLRTFDPGEAPASDYQPDRYRGVLQEPWEGVETEAAIDWPWPEVTPADFTAPATPDGLGFESHTFTADEIAALGLDGLEGGAQGIVLRDPDGTTLHILALRPLFPDEAR